MQFQQLNQAYQSDPRRILGQALMGQGASSAPVRTPLQGLGRLSSALVGAYLKRKAGDAQVERETAMTDQIMGMLPENATAGQRAFAAANPTAFAQMAGQAQFAPTSQAFTSGVDGGGTIYGTRITSPLGPTSETVSGFAAPRAPAKPLDNFRDLTTAEIDKYGLTADEAADYQINTATNKRVKTGGGGVNVNLGDDRVSVAARTKLAEADVSQLGELREESNNFNAQVETINQILDIYDRVDDDDFTGPGGQTELAIKNAVVATGRLFGFDPEKDLGIDIASINNKQNLLSAFSKLSLEMTQILKGALSNRELGVAERATLNFGNTPQANRMIGLQQLASAAKVRFIASEARRYYEKNDGLGSGSLDGKKYDSFEDYKNQIRRNDSFVFELILPQIRLGDIPAFINIYGGIDKLTDEEAELLDNRRQELMQ
ncbi:MAG TPA: hypothetical protein DE147_13700 [Gammaproteobacteria bacterium]|nr:hypothetical protein [Gammaproteobacteria bacterium]